MYLESLLCLRDTLAPEGGIFFSWLSFGMSHAENLISSLRSRGRDAILITEKEERDEKYKDEC